MEQLYTSNSNLKFPLSDFHEEDIPTDILLDMAVSVDSGLDVYLTNLVVTPVFVFLSLEDSDGTPVGHVMVERPSVARIYNLEMTAGGYGWVVFGPGAQREQSYKKILVPLDPSVVVPSLNSADSITLEVNGRQYDMPEVLTLFTTGYVIQNSDSKIELRRNDNIISDDGRVTLFVNADDVEVGTLFTINSVPADEFGNINFQFTTAHPEHTSAYFKSIQDDLTDERLGLVIWTIGVAECDEVSLSDNILCRTDKGITTPLPLDHINCDEDIVCEEDEF